MQPSDADRQRLADLHAALCLSARAAIALGRPFTATLKQAFILQAWVRPAAIDAATAAGDVRRVGILTAASGHGLCLEIRPPASPVLPPSVLFMDAALSPERWHHIALCFSDQGTQAFLDGRAINTRPPKTGFDLSGDWTLGRDYAGDIGLLSIHDTVWPAPALAAQRFDVPRRGESGLVAAWTLEGSGKQWLLELNSEKRSALPGAEALWVSARFPRSLLDSSMARHALSVATQRSNAVQQQATAAAQATLEHARQKAQAQRRQGQALASAHVHAARIERVVCIAAGALHSRGPRGAVLPAPAVMPATVLRDVVVDQASGISYAVQQRQNPVGSAIVQLPAAASAAQDAPTRMYDTPQAIHALALVPDDAQGQRFLYWIEAPGVLMRQGEAGKSELVARLAAGRGGEWCLATDPARNRLCWSNGQEIWSGTWITHKAHVSSAAFDRLQILVSHGQSPHPIALTVDEDSGDLYWLDKELDALRCLTWGGTRVRDVYEALSPREGIAIDTIDPSEVPGELSEHPALKHKRLYWNAEHRQQLEVAVIDDAGLFCWLQRLAPHPLQPNNVSALEDTRLSGVAWQAIDMPRQRGEAGDSFRHAWPSGGHAVHAIVESAAQADSTAFSFTLWSSATRQRKPLFEWRKGHSLFGPRLFDHDSKAGRLVFANSGRAATVALAGAMLPVEMSVHPASLANITAVALSRDGTLAVLAFADGVLGVWHATTGALLRTLSGHSSSVYALATCEMAGRACVVSAALDGEIRRWDLATGACLQTLHAGARCVPSLAITPDGHRLVLACNDALQVWHLPQGTRLHTLRGHAAAVLDVSLSADGARAVSSSMDKTVKLWNLDTGSCQRTLAGGHTDGVLHAVCSADGSHVLSIGRDMTLEWPIDSHRPQGALAFGGGHDHVDLGPLWLDCRHGFAVEVQLRRPAPQADMVLLSLGNGDDGDNMTLTLARNGQVGLAVGDAAARVVALSAADKTLAPGDWQTLTVSVDAVGLASFCINGHAAGAAGPLSLPRTGVRLHNRVGCSNAGEPRPLVGEVSVLRLWNRALGPAEVKHFHSEPQRAPQAPLRTYHRSVMDYRNGRPCLMSGMSDGATPAVALFELAVDRALQIQTRTGVAHARLVAAQHDLHLAQERAAARRTAEEQAAQARINAAHEQNQAHHVQAQAILQQASATAAERRATALRDKATAGQKARQRITAAEQAARRQRDEAHLQAANIEAQARQKAGEVKRAANRKLQDAQAEKAKYQ